MGEKIQKFTDLNAWKEGHKLVLLVYKAVKKYPRNEEFVLKSQILRAVISITSNVAEGFGRFSIKEKVQFYFVAQASLVEVQNQLIISRDVGYTDNGTFNLIWNQTVIVHKLLTGLIRSLKSK
jgi:four helix bundle protein